MVNTTTFLTTVLSGVRATVVAESTHLAVGVSGATATIGDTTLGDEKTRKARQEYTEGTSDVITSLWINSAESNGNTLKEVGVFDASSGGNMASRNTFTDISKTSSIEVWIDVEEQIEVTQ